MLASPMSRSSIITGKMVAYIIMVFLQIAIMIVIANLLFDMPVGKSLWVLFVLTFVLALAVTAIGMFYFKYLSNQRSMCCSR